MTEPVPGTSRWRSLLVRDVGDLGKAGRPPGTPTPTPATESAVVVLVPELETLVGRWRARLDPSAAWGMPAHVTLLYPFVAPHELDDRVLDRVAGLVAGHDRFTTRFARTRWFGTRVMWAAPEPPDPFRRLTAALVSAFPGHPPYGGTLDDDPTPHLTIGDGAPMAALREAEQAVGAGLPITVAVTTVAVMTGTFATDTWATLAEFRLGGPSRGA